eukprot:TRINITY_DN3226_c0_g1_i1.p1 TRINITY_DN3226_c0_g1~~TRINITY_DN3226_c0_g1_i1.p1  ORF type:complete len:475 (+),score=78.45 TRINITY_DN3226_c0_g1_i1:34-1425(+)
MSKKEKPEATVVRIPPFHYIHVLNSNLNVTRLETGPKSLTTFAHEQVVLGPLPMVICPPRNYCVIQNPVIMTTDESGKTTAMKDQYGSAKLRHGDSEIRFEQQEPFPLFPGEVLLKTEPLRVVPTDVALRIRAVRTFYDRYAAGDNGKPLKRDAGDEWLFVGSATYMPQVEAEILEEITATVLKSNQALHLRARKEFVDRKKVHRKAGEEWRVITEGAYLPGVDEYVVKVISGTVLQRDENALHLRATQTFRDCFGKERKAGEEWLVTFYDHQLHIPDVFEQVVAKVKSIKLTDKQYCVVLDPVDETGKPQLGQRKLVRGPACFFLQPGEHISEEGIRKIYVLNPEKALQLRAKEEFVERVGNVAKHRHPGESFFVYGPGYYVPPLEAEVIGLRRALLAIPLGNSKGIYLFYSKSSFVLSVILLVVMLWLLDSKWIATFVALGSAAFWKLETDYIKTRGVQYG